MGNEFQAIYDLELKCWCIGLSRVRDELSGGVLHKVIKEFSPVFRESIEHLYAFDILHTAASLVSSAKCRETEKEVTFYILSHLPTPAELTKEQALVLTQIVDKVERVYGGAFKRLAKKWRAAAEKTWDDEVPLFQGLSFPPKPASAGR